MTIHNGLNIYYQRKKINSTYSKQKIILLVTSVVVRRTGTSMMGTKKKDPCHTQNNYVCLCIFFCFKDTSWYLFGAQY